MPPRPRFPRRWSRSGSRPPRNELVAKQDLEKAQTTEAINRELLGILGYHEIKPEDIDPAIQKETISHYTVTAPFDGTVIGKDVVLLDQVDSTKQMFSVADFATVWVQADVYEKYLPLLQQLLNKVVRFRLESYPGRTFEARVFYLGNMVDAKTRTVDMRAIVDNPDRILKPGMFVELELPAQGVPGVLQVPASAIQTHEKSTFVFVQKGDGLFERRDVRVGRTGQRRGGDHCRREGGGTGCRGRHVRAEVRDAQRTDRRGGIGPWANASSNSRLATASWSSSWCCCWR